MTPAQWSVVKEILSGALERPPAERSDYLEVACGGDPDLRRRVEALIAADQQTWGLMETPAVASSSLAKSLILPSSGERIGAYEILEEIGHGGMGVVFLARRADDQYEKNVAIKLARLGVAGDWVERRFRAERQIVASLDHPHIARLIDGGATTDGRAYLVMEYVEGEPLGRWCDAHGLGTRERLGIFLDVCAAVAYAHQHLVVHRDLKPANILVTPEGAVKLLDFGIAKLIGPEVTGEPAERTGTLLRLLTPDYASPEQIRGEAISTSSDVYALGIVLYELLTGSKPYRVTDRSPAELIETICETDPPRPSSVARPPLAKELAGDLDTIIATALRKEAARRYASVGALADDIRRHLSGLPVEARTDAFGYRAGRFVRRHRAPVFAAILVVAALAGGLVMTLREARRARAAEARAERRFQDVRRLANVFLFEIHDQIRELPGSTAARQTLVKRALEYLDSLSRERERDGALTLELASAYQRVGDVQGNPYQPNLGDSRGAAASYRKEIALLQPLAAAGGLEAKDALAKAWFSLGGLEVTTGERKAAVTMSQKGLELVRELSAAAPGDAARSKKLAMGLRFHAFSLMSAGRGPEASTLLTEQAVLLRRLRAAAPQDRQILREIGQNRYLTGSVLFQTGDAAGARAAFTESIDAWRTLVAENPASPDLRRGLLWALTDDAQVLGGPEDLRAGLERFREARDVAESLVQSDPRNTDARLGLAMAEINVGTRLRDLANSGETGSHWSKARALLEPIVAADPSNSWGVAVLGNLYVTIAEERMAGAKAGDRKEACDLFGRSFDSLSGLKAVGRLPPDRISALERATAGLASCGQTRPTSEAGKLESPAATASR